MKEKFLESISHYLSEPLWDVDRMIFRGVANKNFALTTSIFRIKNLDDSNRFSYEKDVFNEFKNRSFPFLKNEPLNDFEWLALAQHYGIPTRFLDWTTNPLVALYFAVENNDETDGAVYKMIQGVWQYNVSNVFDIKTECAVLPKHKDIRFINQSGVFTVHPTHRVEFNQESIVKYIIKKENKDSFRWQLAKFGVKPSFIYPSLDGIAKDILGENRNSNYVRENKFSLGIG